MKSDEYWRKRAIRAEEHVNRLGNSALSSDILPLYQKALENINERIRRIFKKFSFDGQLTADEAKELLTAKEDAEELKKIRETLDDIQDPDLQRQARIRVNAPAYAARISREQAVGLAIQTEMAKVAGQQITAMEDLLKPSYEYGKYRTIYDLAKGTGVGIDFTVMPVEAVQQALNDPWNGENFSKRVWDNTDLLAENAKKIITSGIMSGESIGSMSIKLDETMKQGKYNAVRLVRTEANHFYNDGRLKGYADCGIKQYRFLASLDLRTCRVCGKLDGQKFDVDKAEAGKNYPPMHPNDRCTTVAVILIDGKEVNDGGTRWSRNPEKSVIKYYEKSNTFKLYGEIEYVPATMTWSQWYKEKVEGSEVAKLNKKKWDNRHADKKQQDKYRELLGKKVPKDFEKFQQIKYGSPDDDEETRLAKAERWKKIKSEYRAKKNEKSLNNSDDSGKIKSEGMQRKASNTGVFAHLPERMSKKHIREIADKYDFDISGLTLNIDANEELLRFPIAGEAVPEHIGTITFFPNAFRSEEELLRTIYHESIHVRQYRKYGSEYVQNNRNEFEIEAYALEDEFINNLKKEGKL